MAPMPPPPLLLATVGRAVGRAVGRGAPEMNGSKARGRLHLVFVLLKIACEIARIRTDQGTAGRAAGAVSK